MVKLNQHTYMTSHACHMMSHIPHDVTCIANRGTLLGAGTAPCEGSLLEPIGGELSKWEEKNGEVGWGEVEVGWWG